MVSAFQPCLYLGSIILLHRNWINLSRPFLAGKYKASVWGFTVSAVAACSKNDTADKTTLLDICYGNGGPK